MKYSSFSKYLFLFFIMISFGEKAEAKIAMPKILSYNKMVDLIQNGSPLYKACPEYDKGLAQKYALEPYCVEQHLHNANIDNSLKEYLEYKGINSGNSLLHEAAKVKNKQAIEACLKADYNMNARNSVDDTPWMIYGKEEWNRDFPYNKVPSEEDEN